MLRAGPPANTGQGASKHGLWGRSEQHQNNFPFPMRRARFGHQEWRRQRGEIKAAAQD